MSLALIEYDIQVQKYTAGTAITTNCIDLLFINTGTVTAYIDTLPLLAGQSLPINGNLGEITKKPRQLTFANTAGNTEVYFVKRFYISG